MIHQLTMSHVGKVINSLASNMITDDVFLIGLDWNGLQSLGRNWNCRWAGPVALDGGLLFKNKKEGGSA